MAVGVRTHMCLVTDLNFLPMFHVALDHFPWSSSALLLPLLPSRLIWPKKMVSLMENLKKRGIYLHETWKALITLQRLTTFLDGLGFPLGGIYSALPMKWRVRIILIQWLQIVLLEYSTNSPKLLQSPRGFERTLENSTLFLHPFHIYIRK